MFRTRDFILIFTCIVFLVSAIGATVLVQWFGAAGGSESPTVTLSESDVAYEAVIISPETLDRAARLQDMRNKIAAQTVLSAIEPIEVVQEEVSDSDTGTSTDDEVTVAGLDQCASYQPYAGFWDARDLEVVAGEGATLVVRNGISVTGSSTSQTILQLPKRLAAAPNLSCIGSDVIGIANDGSLIRNDEVALYSIFGAEVQIGYALDGFPLYGVSDTEGDNCGGRNTADGYRYELQSSSETIINCFAAAPVKLP